MLSGLLTTFVIGRTLDATAVGMAALALATASLVEIASAAGIQDAIVRARSSHTALTDSAHWAAIILALGGMGVCAVCGGVLAHLYGQAALLPLTTLASLSLVFNAVAAVPSGTLTRKMRAAALARRLAVGKLAALAVLVMLALLDTGPWSVVASYVAGTFASAVAILLTAARLPRFRVHGAELRSLARFASLLSLESIFWVAALRLFGLVFGYFHGLADYGALQFAFRLVDDLATLIQRTILRFGLSYFSALARSNADAKLAFLQGSRFLTAMATPIFAGIALTAHDLVLTVFGERWLVAVPMIQIVAVSWLFGFPRSLVGPLLRAEGKQAILVRYAAAMALFTVGGAFFTAHLSAVAATAAFCFRQVLAVPWGLRVIQREIGVGVRTQLASMLSSVVALLVMTAAVLAAEAGAAAMAPAHRLALSVLAGAAAYGPTLLLLDPTIRALGGAILKRLARRAGLGAGSHRRHPV